MADYIWMLAGGGFFLLFGLVMLFQGRSEQKGYYNSLTDHQDAREFLDHWPPRPRIGAMKLGGWVSLAVGLVLLVMGIIYWLQA